MEYLNSPQTRTLLLFVIRDHIGVTPLSNLQTTLTADLTRIWDSLSKPPALAQAQLLDYFDLAFTALPHKILESQKFEDEVAKLRERFADKSRENYVFKDIYHKRIPADGVAVYMENIWVRHFDILAIHWSDISSENRNKFKVTKTSIFQPNRNFWLSSDVTKSPQLH